MFFLVRRQSIHKEKVYGKVKASRCHGIISIMVEHQHGVNTPFRVYGIGEVGHHSSAGEEYDEN